MLYTPTAPDLSSLGEFMKKHGIPDSCAEIGLRYIEEGERSLIDGLKKVSLPKFTVSHGFGQAVLLDHFEKLFAGKDGRERFLRYIEFIWAAAGSDSVELIYNAMQYPRPVVEDTACAEALSRFFGDGRKGAATALAMKALNLSDSPNRISWLKAENAQLCADALAVLDKHKKGDRLAAVTKLSLCALDFTVDDNVPYISEVCGRIIKVYKKRSDLDAVFYPMLTAALAEAAVYDKGALKPLKEMLKLHAADTAAYALNVLKKSEQVFDKIETFPELVTADYVRVFAERGGVGNEQLARLRTLFAQATAGDPSELSLLTGSVVRRLSEQSENTGIFTESNKYTKRLAKLTVSHPKIVRIVLDSADNSKTAFVLEKILAENDPTFNSEEYDLKGRIQRRITKTVQTMIAKGGVAGDYISGKADYAAAAPVIMGSRIISNRFESNYYRLYGVDDFLKRVFTAVMIADKEYSFNSIVCAYTGFEVIADRDDKEHPDHLPMSIEFMLDGGAPMTDVINAIALSIDNTYYSDKNGLMNTAAETFLKHPELLAGCDNKKMNALGRVLYAKTLGMRAADFKPQILALTSDTSKAVKEVMLGILTADPVFDGDIGEMLGAKKSAVRELALSVIEKRGGGFTEQLQAALEKEKTEKLRLRIAALIGTKGAAAAVKVSSDDQIKKLLKRANKVEWLYDRPLPIVFKTDGTAADTDTMKALMLFYACADKFRRSAAADEIAAELDQKQLQAFAAEVYGRWFERGAEAKSKWVLFFCAVHGGVPMINTLTEQIKHWCSGWFGMRASIAGDAVKAIAMNGSAYALTLVDNMSRKHKSKSIRKSANLAMTEAADGLGITAEELGDRIVPDFGFDENLCRVFDYGSRRFSVYIRPSLELEIFCGEKQIKTMPKPAASDEPQAADAYEQFKEMKKLMKTTVTAQRKRLEYVLVCGRKWTVEGWKALFVTNAVMHCFAIGLIWGIYEGGTLKTTFRYMEDGSFTTSDGDEFELPAEGDIGLVHPLELSDELKAEWTEQLEDFEIKQPFPQLSRRVIKPEESELSEKMITRFKGLTISSMTITGALEKSGWTRGTPGDGGVFDDFRREDVSSRRMTAESGMSVEGFGAMLNHSGMYAAVYSVEAEDIEVGELVFFRAGKVPTFADDSSILTIGEVSPRYFSEIMLQMTSILGTKE